MHALPHLKPAPRQSGSRNRAAGAWCRGKPRHPAAAAAGDQRHRPKQASPRLGFGKVKEQKLSKQQACPCGSGKAFKECCRRYHEGELPPTPEALMRARYSAYAKGNVAFVCETTHPENPLFHGSKNPDGTPSSTLAEDVRASCESISWDRLKTWFKVRGQEGQRAQGAYTQTFVEHSHFKREGGRWLYVNGEQDWKAGGDGSGR
eukprot:scaffold1.g5389.t1